MPIESCNVYDPAILTVGNMYVGTAIHIPERVTVRFESMPDVLVEIPNGTPLMRLYFWLGKMYDAVGNAAAVNVNQVAGAFVIKTGADVNFRVEGETNAAANV